MQLLLTVSAIIMEQLDHLHEHALTMPSSPRAHLQLVVALHIDWQDSVSAQLLTGRHYTGLVAQHTS